MSKKYLYIFTRKDLSPSQIAVQSIHSAYEMGRNSCSKEQHPSVVLLEAKNEERLNMCKEYIESLGLTYKEFREPYYGNSLTSIAVEPITDEDRQMFEKFRLLSNKSFCSC